MTRDEAVQAIQRRFGFLTKREDDIVAEMQISQGRLERGIKLPNGAGTFKPWFLCSEVQSAITVVGEQRVPIPTGFVAEKEDAALWVLDPDAEVDDPWTELVKMEFDSMIQKYPGSGLPKAYAYMGTYFRLGPTPDLAYTLKIVNYGQDTFPATGSATNKWLTYAPEVLWSHTGLAMSTILRDGVAMKEFGRILAEETLSLWINSEERLHANRSYTMGGED